VIGEAETQEANMTPTRTRRSLQEVELIGLDYKAGVPLVVIEARHGISRSGLYQYREREGWPLRRPGGSRPASGASAPQTGTAAPVPGLAAGDGDAALRRQVARLHGFVADRLETILAGGEADPERLDRRAAFLARTMVQLDGLGVALRKRDAQEHRDGEDAPRSLNELRDELCRRLARLRGHARRGELGPRPVGSRAPRDARPLADQGPRDPASADRPDPA
jgi:hypothetical protein